MSLHAVTIEAKNVLVTQIAGRTRREGFCQNIWLEARNGDEAGALALEAVRADLLADPGFVKNPDVVMLTVDQVKLAEDMEKGDGDRSGRVYHPDPRH